MSSPNSFPSALQHYFPDAIQEPDFITRANRSLFQLGFNESNSLACVCLCRDELTASLTQSIQDTWGKAFNFSSLAGMVTVGKTGFNAAHTHAPEVDQRERYIYFAMPHISISSKGELGICNRPGVREVSNACGALIAFHGELSENNSNINLDLDFLDLEQSLLKRRLSKMLSPGSIPSLLELTHLAAQAILEDLQGMIELTVDSEKSDYGVLTGIQIHSPAENYILPLQSFTCLRGKRVPLVI